MKGSMHHKFYPKPPPAVNVSISGREEREERATSRCCLLISLRSFVVSSSTHSVRKTRRDKTCFAWSNRKRKIFFLEENSKTKKFFEESWTSRSDRVRQPKTCDLPTAKRSRKEKKSLINWQKSLFICRPSWRKLRRLIVLNEFTRSLGRDFLRNLKRKQTLRNPGFDRH